MGRPPKVPFAPLTDDQREWIEQNMSIVWAVVGQKRHAALVARIGRDEACQHGFAAMCRAVQTFREGGPACLATHVRCAVEWQTLSLYSRHAGDGVIHVVGPDSDEAVAVFGVTDHEDIDKRIDLADKVRPLLAALHPKYRLVIELYYGFRGRPVGEPEIASTLMVSRARVHQIRQRAIVKLQHKAAGMAAVAGAKGILHDRRRASPLG